MNIDENKRFNRRQAVFDKVEAVIVATGTCPIALSEWASKELENNASDVGRKQSHLNALRRVAARHPKPLFEFDNVVSDEEVERLLEIYSA